MRRRWCLVVDFHGWWFLWVFDFPPPLLAAEPPSTQLSFNDARGASKAGADLLFQIISQRYERGSLIVTTNKAFKQWSSIFSNDAGITSAILDRLLHQAETVVIEGQSYRMKDQIEPPN